jgi:hypothetical protein
MQSEKVLRVCTRMLAQVSSNLGDRIAAAEMLRERMNAGAFGFDALLDYARGHADQAFVADNFFDLTEKAQKIWAEADSRSEQMRTSFTSMSTDPDRSSGHPHPDKEPNWTWVREHTRTSRKGNVYRVKGHWRHVSRRVVKEAWRTDPEATPGAGYEWIADHERWHCHAGHGRMISVRGYWRKKSDTSWRQAA